MVCSLPFGRREIQTFPYILEAFKQKNSMNKRVLMAGVKDVFGGGESVTKHGSIEREMVGAPYSGRRRLVQELQEADVRASVPDGVCGVWRVKV